MAEARGFGSDAYPFLMFEEADTCTTLLGFVRKHYVREVTIHWDACSSPFSYREWLNN